MECLRYITNFFNKLKAHNFFLCELLYFIFWGILEVTKTNAVTCKRTYSTLDKKFFYVDTKQFVMYVTKKLDSEFFLYIYMY